MDSISVFLSSRTSVFNNCYYVDRKDYAYFIELVASNDDFELSTKHSDIMLGILGTFNNRYVLTNFFYSPDSHVLFASEDIEHEGNTFKKGLPFLVLDYDDFPQLVISLQDAVENKRPLLIQVPEYQTPCVIKVHSWETEEINKSYHTYAVSKHVM